MKNTGLIRQLDEMGRLVLPKEIRKSFDLNERDPVSFYIEGDKIILKKHQPACVFCGAIVNTISYKDKRICAECIKNISATAKDEKE